MLIKIAIIGAIVLVVGFIFSSEISGLFPNTTETVPQALKEDADKLSSETINSLEESVDKSINSLEQKFDDSLEEVVESSKDSVQEKIDDSIDYVESSKDSIQETIPQNPIESIGNFFKTSFGLSNS